MNLSAKRTRSPNLLVERKPKLQPSPSHVRVNFFFIRPSDLLSKWEGLILNSLITCHIVMHVGDEETWTEITGRWEREKQNKKKNVWPLKRRMDLEGSGIEETETQQETADLFFCESCNCEPKLYLYVFSCLKKKKKGILRDGCSVTVCVSVWPHTDVTWSLRLEVWRLEFCKLKLLLAIKSYRALRPTQTL